MFKNMLLPLDGSQFSELALPLAVRIAKNADAKLHFVRVHVTAVAQTNAPPQWEIDELIRDKEREHLQAAVARAQTAGVRAVYELLEGPVVHSLERYVQAVAVDLIVMTTHGRSGLTRAVLGSVAEHCVRTSHIPVLLLHPRTVDDAVPDQPEALRRILVALDGSPESEEVLAPAVDLALLSGARVTLARVATAPFDIAATLGVEALREYLERARQQAANYLASVAARLPRGVQPDTLAVTSDRAAKGILKCRDQVGADLIAVATHGRSGWARIAVGSVAESVLHKAPVPVLMLRPASLSAQPADDPALTSTATR